jgi:hypothetical protein
MDLTAAGAVGAGERCKIIVEGVIFLEDEEG